MEHEWKFPCKLESNYDGDTFKLELDVGFALRHYVAIRLYGVDTPELRGGTPETKALAVYVRDEAAKFINMAETTIFHSIIWGGKYGRPIGDILCDDKSLAEWLVENKLAVQYHGGNRKQLEEIHQQHAEELISENKIIYKKDK